MKVKDMMMRDLTSVTNTATLKEVADILSYSRLSGVPVVDNQGKVIGFISEKDIIESAFPKVGMDTDILFARNWAQNFLRLSQVGERLVEDYMTQNPVCVKEDDDDEKVVKIILSEHKKTLPVTRDGRLVGVVTRSNLCRALMEESDER